MGSLGAWVTGNIYSLSSGLNTLWCDGVNGAHGRQVCMPRMLPPTGHTKISSHRRGTCGKRMYFISYPVLYNFPSFETCVTVAPHYIFTGASNIASLAIASGWQRWRTSMGGWWARLIAVICIPLSSIAGNIRPKSPTFVAAAPSLCQNTPVCVLNRFLQ